MFKFWLSQQLSVKSNPRKDEISRIRKNGDLETVIVDERKQAKTTTTQRNVMYRDFNGLMYIRTLRGKRGKCCLFDCLPKKNIEGSCLNVFNTERGFQIPNNWNDRIKAKIKTHHHHYGLGLAPPLSCLLRGSCN